MPQLHEEPCHRTEVTPHAGAAAGTGVEPVKDAPVTDLLFVGEPAAADVTGNLALGRISASGTRHHSEYSFRSAVTGLLPHVKMRANAESLPHLRMRA